MPFEVGGGNVYTYALSPNLKGPCFTTLWIHLRGHFILFCVLVAMHKAAANHYTHPPTHPSASGSKGGSEGGWLWVRAIS